MHGLSSATVYIDLYQRKEVVRSMTGLSKRTLEVDGR